MLYSKELYPRNHTSAESKLNVVSNTAFSVILNNTVKDENGYGLYSIINSVKPLAYFTSIFGNPIVRYKNNDIHNLKLHNKLYSMCVIALIYLLHSFVTPKSWKDTKSDIPLNILTKFFGSLVIFEITYLTFVSTFVNGKQFKNLLQKIDDFDQHFMTSKGLFIKRRIVVIFFIIFTQLEMSCSFLLRPFNIEDVSAYILMYSLILQGAVIIFFLENIYSRQLLFNELLMKKTFNCIPRNKKTICKKSLRDAFTIKIFADSQILEQKLRGHYSWFELMQMYDKTADCVYLFNKIYAGQVFFMFLSGLFCTMLIICRYLSPSLKNFNVGLSDLYLYTCLNCRPVYVSKMCELLTNQKNKTLLLLLSISVYGEMDDGYYDQIQTMINLVATRKIELTTDVYTANLKTVLNFFGRLVSYTVLMIQYFYNNVFSE